MIQITYISLALKPMTTEELLGLLQKCLTNNARDGITGMLLYSNQTFLQALEGDDAIIDGLVDKISKDPRHASIKFLHRRPIQNRQYSDWTMGFKRISDTELQQITGLKNFGERDFNFQNLAQNDDVVEILMDHYRVPAWDPLVRELEASDKVIEHLKKTLSHTRGCVDVACLVLESVVDAGRRNSLSEEHLRLCDTALESLRQV
jgi:Sensors of blue-light using FAD